MLNCRKQKIILWGEAILIIGFTIMLCFNYDVWLDEAFTGIFIRSNFYDMIKATAMDVHPPLYYVLLKLFAMVFGYHIPVLKIFSVLPIAFLMSISMFWIYPKFGFKASFLFQLLLGTLPNSMIKNVEMRMYTWGMLFVFLTALCAYEIWKEDGEGIKFEIGLFTFGLAAAYTHYFALISVAVIYVLFVYWIVQGKKYKKLRKVFASMIGSVFGYLPWLPVFYNQTKTVAGGGWWYQEPILFRSIPSFLSWPAGGTDTAIIEELFLLIVISCFFGLLYRGCSKDKKAFFILQEAKEGNLSEIRTGLSCFLVYLFTILLGVILSKVLKPLYLSRYVFSACGLLYLGIGICANYLKKYVYILLCIFFIGVGIYSYPFVWMEEYEEPVLEEFQNLELFLERQGELSIASESDLWYWILKFYFPQYEVEVVTNISEEKIREGKIIFITETREEVWGGRMPWMRMNKIGSFEFKGKQTLYRLEWIE